MTLSDPRPPEGGHDPLGALLEELVARFDERDVGPALLRDVGLALIRRLAEPGEAQAIGTGWEERWREAARPEGPPMRRQG